MFLTQRAQKRLEKWGSSETEREAKSEDEAWETEEFEISGWDAG